ncbi:nitrate reductase molybdenum cofactor assembly chaperone [Chromobacterium haemolyticum]|uniref:Nitrate reductase molybdenum cofactor assembly chaperone n=1 Tax=Chromobacterium fluminis TaxID=3044269 RepID=A0ABX0LAS3_9NEIS|nr:nitrate reductase molybdenum cofactor assembly chaperone [Chromobacterium haemolyticum]NHR05460.1 nitrate reductase molybdenum cofactor assembly chaperone [Chromobacterium haemolyticum]
MRIYQALSALLCYPEPDLLAAADDIRAEVAAEPRIARLLEPLLLSLEGEDLITLQERYVQTFDRNPSHSLHLFEHIHGEDRARGQAMVDLLAEYQAQGFEPAGNELPDYLPLFLEFLAQCQPEEAVRLLSDAVHVIAHVAGKLADSHSHYAGVLQGLVLLSPVAPEALTVPPVRDMDEMLETFGPGADGVEPLLKPTRPAIAPVNFYPQRPQG